MVVDAPPAVDAWSIFVHTRSAVTAAQYPWRIDYDVAVAGFDGKVPVTDHYRANCEPNDGTIRIFPISDEQLAKPAPVPHGFNTKFTLAICFGLCIGVRLPMGHPAPYQDLIGEPLISPTYMFGLRYTNATKRDVLPVENNPLPTIAVVSTQARDYQVTLLNTEALDNTQTYHLLLKPLRKPKDNRLRELWVGVNDYLPRRAVLSGNFTAAPLVDVPWTVDFSVRGGAPFISQESADGTLYLPHHRVVQDATIAFESIGEAGTTIYDRPLLAPESTDTTLAEPEH
ncbi:MAG: hypothetical protein WB615_03445 [Candidatus Tumulicola sp.]